MRKVMVTGSRTWGRCTEDIPEHLTLLGRRRCPVYRAAFAIMVGALADAGIVVGTEGRHLPSTELLHGDAQGADRMAAGIWGLYGLGPVTAFPANWQELGNRAGSVRNGILVAHMPDIVLAFHLNNSPGTADAIRQAKDAGLDVHVYPR